MYKFDKWVEEDGTYSFSITKDDEVVFSGVGYKDADSLVTELSEVNEALHAFFG